MLRKLKISKAGSGSTFLCKSRNDGTLLTVSATEIDDTLIPCGNRYLYARRLKSAVNKVSSLRDLHSLVA